MLLLYRMAEGLSLQTLITKQRSCTMTGTTLQRALIRVQHVVRGVMAAGLLLGATLAFAANAENTLLVWAGDQARVAPDFIAVVDFDRDSRNYGKVLRTVSLSGPSAVGNEPHHVGISRDGRTLAPRWSAEHFAQSGRGLLLRRYYSTRSYVPRL